MSKCIFCDKEYRQDKKKYGYYNKMTTTCDICGKEIIGIENFINAGDKVVCSENCKQTAYFNDYVEHCEIGLSVDEIMTIN